MNPRLIVSWHPDDVIEPRFAWRFPASITIDDAIRAAGTRHGLDERVTGILAARGVAGNAALDAFFAPPLAALHDPAHLPDAAAFVARVRRARDTRERILVFGDFDADGLTGLAILTLALDMLGIESIPYVPSRLDEGHGLSLAAVSAAGAAGATVIITVDCGTTSVAEVAAAVATGIDVLVTDHHHVPPVLPAAVAIVNPKRPDSAYPDRLLAGSGVAFKLAQLLLADEPGGPEAAIRLADLATIGSVADLVPLLGETRAIVRLGLDQIRTNPRPGVAALLASSGAPLDRIDTDTLGFAVSPRINAAGRMGEAMVAARLLLARDAEEATTLAAELETANLARRDLTKQAMTEARAAVEASAADGAVMVIGATIVRGQWPVGIVGLVAGRLVEELGRPAVVGSDLGDTIRASCRSDGSLDLGAALETCGDLFIRHGGHAGAAGFEIETAKWPEFVRRFGALAAATAPADPRLSLPIDLAVPAASVDYALHRDLARLAPCGFGNPEPAVAVLGLTVTRINLATGGHSQLTLKRERDVLDGIAFGRSDLAETVQVGDRVDVVGRLASRRFGGFESLQLEIRDVATSGSHPEAAMILAGAGSPPVAVVDAPGAAPAFVGVRP
jgi:single-stranded-DNA-specific exonuclease